MQDSKPHKHPDVIARATARLAAITLVTVLLMPLLAYAQATGAKTHASEALASTGPGSGQGDSAQTDRMSREFSAAAVQALSTLRTMRTDLAYTLNNGYPLEKLWLGSDRDRAADALDLAAIAASTQADQATLRELLQYFDALQRWSDELLAQDREMRLAQHYMTLDGALQNDDEYQALLRQEESLSVRLGSIRASVQPGVADETGRATAGQAQ